METHLKFLGIKPSAYCPYKFKPDGFPKTDNLYNFNLFIDHCTLFNAMIEISTLYSPLPAVHQIGLILILEREKLVSTRTLS